MRKGEEILANRLCLGPGPNPPPTSFGDPHGPRICPLPRRARGRRARPPAAPGPKGLLLGPPSSDRCFPARPPPFPLKLHGKTQLRGPLLSRGRPTGLMAYRRRLRVGPGPSNRRSAPPQIKGGDRAGPGGGNRCSSAAFLPPARQTCFEGLPPQTGDWGVSRGTTTFRPLLGPLDAPPTTPGQPSFGPSKLSPAGAKARGLPGDQPRPRAIPSVRGRATGPPKAFEPPKGPSLPTVEGPSEGGPASQRLATRPGPAFNGRGRSGSVSPGLSPRTAGPPRPGPAPARRGQAFGTAPGLLLPAVRGPSLRAQPSVTGSPAWTPRVLQSYRPQTTQPVGRIPQKTPAPRPNPRAAAGPAPRPSCGR